MYSTPYQPISLSLDASTRIHALPAGTVAVRPPHRELSGPPALRFPRILASQQWTEALPIWTWVIESREGNFLIDTGENVQVLDPAYLGSVGSAGWVSRRILQIGIRPEEQLDARLAAIGLSEKALDRVILTHLHLDHTDGLRFVASRPLLISEAEWQQPFGAVLETFPKGLQKELLRHPPDGSPFGAGLALTPSITLVPTRGHTLGHQSVIFRHGGIAYFFAGDVAFSEKQLLAGRRAGIILDWQAAARSYEAVRTLARSEPLVFLPSHDPESGHRLLNRQTMLV